MVRKENDFERDGYVVLRGVFSEDVLDGMRELLVSIVRYAETNREDPFTRYYLRHRADQGVLYDLCQRHPEFEVMARNPDILDALEGVLGPDILLYENSVVYKPKGKKNGVPFHQDFISRPNEPRKFIAWMAVDPVTRDGGALKFLPGSHKAGFLKWHRVRGETHHDRIDTGQYDTSDATYVELDPGDVLIFNQLIVHGSDEAHTDSLRLVYRVSYQGFDEIYSPRGAPLVVRGGRPETLSERFKEPYAEPGKAMWFLNKVGKRLTELGR